MSEFSSNIANLEPSATIALASRVKARIAEGHDIIDLTAGEPDFPTPRFIAEAGVRAIQEGYTRYTPAAGIPPLRAAIAAALGRLSGRTFDPAGVVVSSGAKQALFNSCFALFGPGDEVLVPAPYWTTYPALVHLSRAEPIFVEGARERAFKVTPDDLEAVATDRTRGLMLNTPCNPTGSVYGLDELREIALWAEQRGVWIISDEIYRRIYRDGLLAPSWFDLEPRFLERAVVIDGASKAFSMTGWRMGFSYSSPALAAELSALQSQTTSHAATPTQHAALAAYAAGEDQWDEFARMAAAFEHRRALLTRWLAEQLPDVRYVPPEGAFYLFIEKGGLARPGETAHQVAERLIEEAGVALVPGEAFGAPDHLRLSYAAGEGALAEAVRRMAATVPTAAATR